MRIVSLAPSNTEILFELGLGDEVVATTSLCDYPEEARGKQSLGGWNKGLDTEKVVELQPDLAIASDDLQDEIAEELKGKGVEVLQVKPHTLEEVFESIYRIGKAVDRERKAEKLVERMKDRLDSIRLEKNPRIYCEEWMDPPMVSGNWIPGIVRSIGGEYFIREGERSRKFELDELKSFDPEYIFLNVCGAGENIKPGKVLNRKEWKDITAVERKNVYVIDDALLNRPGPRLVEGAERVEELLESQ